MTCPIFGRSKGEGEFCEEVLENGVCVETSKRTRTSKDRDRTTHRGMLERHRPGDLTCIFMVNFFGDGNVVLMRVVRIVLLKVERSN